MQGISIKGYKLHEIRMMKRGSRQPPMGGVGLSRQRRKRT
jgi:hypothetical protein